MGHVGHPESPVALPAATASRVSTSIAPLRAFPGDPGAEPHHGSSAGLCWSPQSLWVRVQWNPPVGGWGGHGNAARVSKRAVGNSSLCL